MGSLADHVMMMIVVGWFLGLFTVYSLRSWWWWGAISEVEGHFIRNIYKTLMGLSTMGQPIAMVTRGMDLSRTHFITSHLSFCVFQENLSNVCSSRAGIRRWGRRKHRYGVIMVMNSSMLTDPSP